MKVYAADLVNKNELYQFSVLVLAPFERNEGSKVGIYDEVLILDDVRAPWLDRLLHQQSLSMMKSQGASASMWDFNAKQFLEVWRACVQCLGVEELAKSPYQNRHAGASRDHLMKLRSIASIQRRGRWAVDSSARIYDKPGRLQQMINKFGKEWMGLGEDIRLNFERYYHSGSVALPRQLLKRIPDHFKERSF